MSSCAAQRRAAVRNVNTACGRFTSVIDVGRAAAAASAGPAAHSPSASRTPSISILLTLASSLSEDRSAPRS